MPPPITLLVDNGSLRPSATLALRKLAAGLATTTGRVVLPVSLLHSAAVDPAELEGRPAELLQAALERLWAEGRREADIVPLFFGPGSAIMDHMPELVRQLCQPGNAGRVRIARCLVDATDPHDDAMAGIITDNIREVLPAAGHLPHVLLVDHGSPTRAVTDVRNRVAAQLARLLRDEVAGVRPASMERRGGAEHDFSEPLLERALLDPSLPAGPVVVALLFALPGRHAGPGGDVERIWGGAMRVRPGLRCFPTRLAGEHPRMVELLAARLRELEVA